MEIVMLIVAWIVCYLLCTLIHELGHVICGLVHGWKLFLLVAGPLKLYRESMDFGIKAGIEKKVWAKILLAGSLASIIFGICIIPPFFMASDKIVLLILCMLCLMLTAMGIMCIVPMKMKTGLLYNDGTGYQRLHKGGQEDAEERVPFQLLEVGLSGRAGGALTGFP